MGSQPSLSISGFSPDSRYYVFTEQDSRKRFVHHSDLRPASPKHCSLPKVARSLPISSQTQMTCSPSRVGPTGDIAGVQRVTLPSRAEQSIYKPPQGEQIGLLLISPDLKKTCWSMTSPPPP